MNELKIKNSTKTGYFIMLFNLIFFPLVFFALDIYKQPNFNTILLITSILFVFILFLIIISNAKTYMVLYNDRIEVNELFSSRTIYFNSFNYMKFGYITYRRGSIGHRRRVNVKCLMFYNYNDCVDHIGVLNAGKDMIYIIKNILQYNANMKISDNVIAYLNNPSIEPKVSPNDFSNKNMFTITMIFMTIMLLVFIPIVFFFKFLNGVSDGLKEVINTPPPTPIANVTKSDGTIVNNKDGIYVFSTAKVTDKSKNLSTVRNIYGKSKGNNSEVIFYPDDILLMDTNAKDEIYKYLKDNNLVVKSNFIYVTKEYQTLEDFKSRHQKYIFKNQ